jgi:CheY-like chemotaxis protein
MRQIAAGEAGMKILYVEDNDDNVYMLKNRLSRAGFSVVVATDGAQGIAMATSEQPDLILMDLTLPDIRGEEATRRIKADPATKQIPVIALTANAMAGDREKAYAPPCGPALLVTQCQLRTLAVQQKGHGRYLRSRVFNEVLVL